MNEQIFKTEQFYMPSKFVPPFGIGDRYTFPAGDIWQISDVTLESMGSCHHHVLITIHWRRPLYPDDEWLGTHRVGGGNWSEGATATKVWDYDRSGV